MYWIISSIVIPCMINYFRWIIMRWYLFTYIVFINYLVIDINNWLCISFFLKSNECIKLTLGFNVDTMEVLISYNIITVWCIQIILLSTVEILVNISTSHLLINVKIFLPCFLLDKVNAITIHFTFVKKCLGKIEIKPGYWEDIQFHEHRSLIDGVINIIIDSILF